MTIIEFCAGNDSQAIIQRLREQTSYEIIEYGCLGNCGECYLFPFAYVNGEIVAAESDDKLFESILRIAEAHERNP